MALSDESIVFVFLKGSKVLLEERNKHDGSAIWCFPGGGVEDKDAVNTENYVTCALKREVQEEMGITIFQPVHLRSEPIGSKEKVFHFFLIRQWKGRIPKRIIDTRHRLKWIDINEYITSIEAPVFREFAESIVKLL